MNRNVWEWCNDWYGDKYYFSSVGSDLRGPDSGASRVVRGDSWSDVTSDLRATFRNRYGPVITGVSYVFRPVRTVGQEK